MIIAQERLPYLALWGQNNLLIYINYSYIANKPICIVSWEQKKIICHDFQQAIKFDCYLQ